MSRILGVDVGITGALALLINDQVTAIADMPVVEIRNKRRVDPAQLAILIEGWNPTMAIIEIAGARPHQGVASMFGFGRSYGVVIGVLAALKIPTTEVAAGRWKRVLGVPAGKDGARARASQLMPSAARHWPLKKHDGRAEATLLALYGERMNGARDV